MNERLKEDAIRLFNAGLKSSDAYSSVKKNVILQKDVLLFNDLFGNTVKIKLRQVNRLYVVGAGKAAAYMAESIEGILNGKISSGIISVKREFDTKLKYIKQYEAGHPLPDETGYYAAKEIFKLAAGAGENDLIINLISGGGSALLPLPADDISLEDKIFTSCLLLECGADIHEINCIRKHLSKLKGGQLSRVSFPAAVISIILSDVIGDKLDAIASGLTAADETTFNDAIAIVRKYDLENRLPMSIMNHLSKGSKGKIPETVKTDDPCLIKTQNVIIANNDSAIEGVKKRAESLGYRAYVVSKKVKGEARKAAQTHINFVRQFISDMPDGKSCIISGGETTVTVKGKGKGGRNTEFALASALEMRGMNNTVLLSAGTDGNDGTTDAAGAFAYGTTIQKAESMGLFPIEYLNNNDSYTFFEKLNDLLITGSTKTNVMDIQIVLTNRQPGFNKPKKREHNGID